MTESELDKLPLLQIIEMSRAIALQQGDDHVIEFADEVEDNLHRLEHLYLSVPAHVR